MEKNLKDWIGIKIPAVRNFEFGIQKIAPGFISLEVPLAAHINHKGTAFGGSLYNSAVLACYLLVYSELTKQNISSDSFVISDGKIKYLKPVAENFQVNVTWESLEVASVVKALRSKKKARWILTANILCKGLTCAVFEGRFVLEVPG